MSFEQKGTGVTNVTFSSAREGFLMPSLVFTLEEIKYMSVESRAEAKSLAIFGTASHVGKSTLATGLNRVFHQDGYSVAPFKASNVSLNSGVTVEGGEMARSQIVQAEAAGVEPQVDMNPILLKETEGVSQYIVLGKPVKPEEVGKYYGRRWDIVTESLDRLRAKHELVVIEGSGSPSEMNLWNSEIANLRLAEYAQSPIVLVSNIDPQGAWAAVVGTHAIFKDRTGAVSRVKGFVINNLRGERQYVQSGLDYVTKKTGWPCLGTMPYMENLGIADEDTFKLIDKETKKKDAVLDAVVIITPSLQNSDDFDPLLKAPGVQVRFVDDPNDFQQPDIVLLGGSKGTVEDLTWLRERGFDKLVQRQAEEGKAVIGVCGGFQMLGEKILDPDGVESSQPVVEGLGLLPIVTKFEKDQEKVTQQVTRSITSEKGLLRGAVGMPVSGYEIHMARTVKADGSAIESVTTSPDKQVIGTYFHGVFKNDQLRQVILENIAREKGVTLPFDQVMEPGVEYNVLADIVRKNIDMDMLYKIICLPKPMTPSERHFHDLLWAGHR